MNRLKAHWRILAVVLALVLWAAWYARPVDIYKVAPGIKEPDAMDFVLYELGSSRKDYPIQNISPEDPEWRPALEAVEALRFRRPPWNLVLQFIPKRTTTGRATHDGDLNIIFHLHKQGKVSIHVQFFIDEWTYHSPYATRNLTLWVTDARESGETLAKAFLPFLEESEETDT